MHNNLSLLTRLAVVCLPLSLGAQTAYDVGLIGDMPYGASAEPRYERLIADINKTGVDFTVHIGDTKNGSSRCDDSHYVKSLNWFNSFDSALIYSVGDNEWTDCMRTNNGAYDPLGRLALVRKTYFTNNMSLGRRPIPLQRQSDDSKYSLYVENAMYVKAPVVFLTLHMPGSNNNLEYKTVQGAPNPYYDNDKEYTARNAANIAWLRKGFQTARDNSLLGVMIMIQANVFEAFLDTGVGATHSGFSEFVKVLREETNKFKGEVVLVSGDSHYMRVDKPLTDKYPACVSETGECTPFDAALDARGSQVLNFTRLEVPGSAAVHWAICHVKPSARNLFQFEFMIVPEPASAASPVTGPTPVVTVQAPLTASGSYETSSFQIAMDASQSTSSNSGLLTYSWSSSAGYPAAAISKADTATPLVQFSGRGTYQFTLTVTDRTGATSTAKVTIRYV